MEDHSPLRVVAIGGGTGLSALLQGLKQYTRPGDPDRAARGHHRDRHGHR